MEIADMSTFWINGVLGYVRERYPLCFFLPLAAGFTAVAFIATSPGAWTDILLCWITAILMLFQFRLRDDLGDLAYDRLHHPERVLSRAEAANPYFHLAGIAGLVSAMLFVMTGRSYVG